MYFTVGFMFVYICQSENVRWAHSVAQYHEQEETLCGDVLLTAAFISYAGSFSKKYRRELLDNLWMPFLRHQKVTMIKTIVDYSMIIKEYHYLVRLKVSDFSAPLTDGHSHDRRFGSSVDADR